jgi:glyoxalase/bleomycin resistance protein/dioxygenase superfamily protein
VAITGAPSAITITTLPTAVHRSPSVITVVWNPLDLDERVRALELAGLSFVSGPRDERWLWGEARLRDPDGNAICLYRAGTNRRFPPWRLERVCSYMGCVASTRTPPIAAWAAT